jgi:phosphonoacetaldehyde hydrolase
MQTGSNGGRYRGPLKAVILDWAGTAVDFGSFAPVAVLIDVFAARGVPITASEARADMGLLKKDHIRAISRKPEVSERWRQANRSAPGEAEVEQLFADFIPKQIAILDRHSDVIAGVSDAVFRMRARGLKIGGTTGYTRPMLEKVIGIAAKQGYMPDESICPDDAGAGRPMPWMCFEIARRLGVYPPASFVKIGDTPVDIEEALNAGMWSVGVAATGNEIGLTQAEFDALGAVEREARVAGARSALLKAGAHYVIDRVAESDPVLDEIERRLRVGDRP